MEVIPRCGICFERFHTVDEIQIHACNLYCCINCYRKKEITKCPNRCYVEWKTGWMENCQKKYVQAWLETQKFECDECHQEIEYPFSKIDNHFKFDCPERLEKCRYSDCDQKFKHSDLVSHLQTCEFKTDICPRCQLEVTILKHKCPLIEKPCSECKKLFNEANMKIHLEENHFKCKTCNLRNFTIQTINDHENNKCPGRIVQCSDCKINIRFRKLKNHQTNKCKNRIITCPCCLDVKILYQDLNNHLKTDCQQFYKPCTQDIHCLFQGKKCNCEHKCPLLEKTNLQKDTIESIKFGMMVDVYYENRWVECQVVFISDIKVQVQDIYNSMIWNIKNYSYIRTWRLITKHGLFIGKSIIYRHPNNSILYNAKIMAIYDSRVTLQLSLQNICYKAVDVPKSNLNLWNLGIHGECFLQPGMIFRHKLSNKILEIVNITEKGIYCSNFPDNSVELPIKFKNLEIM